MATEIVRWCDAHMMTDERVAAAPHALQLDGKTGTVDLCPEHAKALLVPLLDMLAGPVRTGAGTGRPPVDGDAPCLFCDVTYRGDRLAPHVAKRHGLTFADAYGLVCPLCDDGRQWTNSTTLGSHSRAHNLKSVGDLWAQAVRDGDPHGRLAERRALVSSGVIVAR